MIRRVLLYLMVLAVPAFLCLTAWQSARYADLERELFRMEKTQEEWVEANKRLIAGITILSSPERIERAARDDLGLHKKRPEEVLQISISDIKSAFRTDASVINGEAYE